MRTRLFATVAGLLLLLAVPSEGCAAGRQSAPAGIDSLVILHTNDVHSHLDPFEVSGGARVGGVAARAALVGRQRALGGRLLLLDAGDLVQGTPYYNRFRGEPDHRLLDLLGYDAIALGNHDLDDGAAAWRRRASATRTPILSANVFAVAESAWAGGSDPPITSAARRGATWIGGRKVPPGVTLRYLATPYTIVERGGLRIALFGLTTPSLDRVVSARQNQGVAIGSAVAAAQELVPRLRRQADLVIALTHLGVDEDRRLVDHVPGIDLVIGGHSHTPLFRPTLEKAEGGRATPIAQAGSWGRYLGRTTLRWSGDREAKATFGRLIPVRPEEGEDASVEAIVASYRSRLGTDLNRIVYRSTKRVETSSLREGDSPLGNFVADVIRERAGADIAVMNSGGIRAPLPAGEVRERDLVTMLPFDNRIVVVSMTGAQVQRLLDRIARRLGKGGFAHVSGVSYVIQRDWAVEVRVWRRDGERAAVTRARDASRVRDEAPIDVNHVYRVATIDFLADGGDAFDEVRDAGAQEKTGALLSDAAIEFLRAHPDYSFRKDNRVQWRGSGETLRDLRVR